MFVLGMIFFCWILQLRQRVNAIELSSAGESSSAVKHNEKNIRSILKKQQQDAWEAAAEKRMQKLMRRFGSIFPKVSSWLPCVCLCGVSDVYVLWLSD